MICYMSAAIAEKCAAEHHGVVKTRATVDVSPSHCLYTRMARKKRRDAHDTKGVRCPVSTLDSRQVARLAKSCLDSSPCTNQRCAARSSEK